MKISALRQDSIINLSILVLSAMWAVSSALADESIPATTKSNIEELSDTDLAAVYGLFVVSPDDPEVLDVGGAITVHDDGRHIITAYLTTPVAVSDQLTCIADTKIRFGRKDADIVEWQLDILDPIRIAWKLDAPGVCDVRDEKIARRTVEVGLSVPIHVIPAVLRSESQIFQAVFEFPEGAPYQHWDDARMSHFTTAKDSMDTSQFYAAFVKNGETDSPKIYFYLGDNGIKAEAVHSVKIN